MRKNYFIVSSFSGDLKQKIFTRKKDRYVVFFVIQYYKSPPRFFSHAPSFSSIITTTLQYCAPLETGQLGSVDLTGLVNSRVSERKSQEYKIGTWHSSCVVCMIVQVKIVVKLQKKLLATDLSTT